MPRIAWRVNRSTGRQRPFRPALGGCLLWFLIVVAVLLVVALLLAGTQKGAKVSLGRPAAVPVTLTLR
jgi:ABC-type lipoprotein release transport system permease subunit